MQLDNITKKEYQTSFHCVKTLVQSHGPRIVYTGHVINTIREATFIGNYFFVYEGMREFLIQSSPLSVQVAVPVSGGFAGAISWFISFPLDCVRAGVQGQPLPPRKSAYHVFSTLVTERGLKGLYSGASASIARAFLVSGSRFSAYEGALWIMRGGRNYERHHD
jgi:solute carrier family 25 carnitine/acylcarnitine transporter 20/29